MPRYTEVRKVLSAPYSGMSPDQIERMMESYNVNAEDMEDFLSTLGNIGRGVVSALPAALPLVGTVFGGPLGGMLGGVAGQALGSLVPGQRPAPGHPQPAIPQPGQPMPAAPGQVPGGSPAAGQLLQMIFRPETLQALISMLLGQAGRPSVPVGNTQVANGGFANLLSVLANQAAAEHNAISRGYTGEDIPGYMQSYAGEAYGDRDPAIPEHRAAALLELLQESEIEQSEGDKSLRPRQRSSFQEVAETDEGIDEALYDEMDLNELYAEYEFA